MLTIKNYLNLNIIIGITLALIPLSVHTKNDQSLTTMEIRTLQTREFPNLSSSQAYQIALSTFQDLGFIITETSPAMGLIAANQTHPDLNQVILATLTLSLKNDSVHTIIARLSLSAYPLYNGEEGANLNGGPPRQSEIIRSPVTYQQFFDAFSYSLSLHQNYTSR